MIESGFIQGENGTGDDPIRMRTHLLPWRPRWRSRAERAVYSTYNPCARVIYRRIL